MKLLEEIVKLLGMRTLKATFDIEQMSVGRDEACQKSCWSNVGNEELDG